MIRKLKEEDRSQVLAYLNQEPSLNLFIIGDIENFGFDQPFQTVYGEFNETGTYLSVLLFYRDNVVYYSHNCQFNPAYVPIIKSYKVSYMSMKDTLAKLLHPYFPNFAYKEMFFAEAREFLHNEVDESLPVQVLTTKEEFGKLYDFLLEIEEFTTATQTREEYIDSRIKALHTGIVYALEVKGKYVSTAATTAETSTSAMVVGVATSIPFRGQGYASKIVSKLMDYYFQKQKYVCLFYDNPSAGKIYLRLGFKNIDKWVVMYNESNN